MEAAHLFDLAPGAEALSTRLRWSLNPACNLFKSSHQQQAASNRNSSRSFVLLSALCYIGCVYSITLSILDKLTDPKLNDLGDIGHIFKGYFLLRVYIGYICLYLTAVSTIMLSVLVKRASIIGLISTPAYLVEPARQVQLASQSFRLNTFRSALKSAFLIPLFYTDPATLVALLVITMVLDMALTTPLMYIHYLAGALAEHVKRFSQLHVDSMFDQFIEGPEVERASCAGNLLVRLRASLLFFRHRFNSNRYLELEEMKMTHLSDGGGAKMSAAARQANQQLIKRQLERTQLMLSQLRDAVDDLNGMSAPVTLMEILQATYITVLVTIGSIQLKFFRSFNVIVLVNTSSVLNLSTQVYYTCTCLDRTGAQLELLVNKLFDFIIINQSSGGGGKTCPRQDDEADCRTETWSQFQYIRQLSETIRFSIGSLLPVSRRQVLSILTHVLSTVFITIEVMNIVDTKSPTVGH